MDIQQRYNWNQQLESVTEKKFYEENSVSPENQKLFNKVFANFQNTTEIFNTVIQNKEFTILGNVGKDGLPARLEVVFKHVELPGFIFKMKNPTKTKDYPEEVNASGLANYQSALRIAYANRMRSWVDKNGHNETIVIPQKKIYTLSDTEEPSDDTAFVASSEVKEFVHGPKGLLFTAANINNLEESKCRALAELCHQFVLGTGFMDGHFFNIQVDAKGQVFVIDMHPERTTEAYFTNHKMVSDAKGTPVPRDVHVQTCIEKGMERLHHNLIGRSKEIWADVSKQFVKFTEAQFKTIHSKQEETEVKCKKSGIEIK